MRRPMVLQLLGGEMNSDNCKTSPRMPTTMRRSTTSSCSRTTTTWSSRMSVRSSRKPGHGGCERGALC
eukprot:14151152-Heterocapsa_arctica.AAC.1